MSTPLLFARTTGDKKPVELTDTNGNPITLGDWYQVGNKIGFYEYIGGGAVETLQFIYGHKVYDGTGNYSHIPAKDTAQRHLFLNIEPISRDEALNSIGETCFNLLERDAW